MTLSVSHCLASVLMGTWLTLASAQELPKAVSVPAPLIQPAKVGGEPTREPQTERDYLSGRGPKDAVRWQFCVTGGRRAGEWTTLPVPSNWELHGFGTYNYGREPTPKADEHGLYRIRFNAPQAWKDRRLFLVFDGVMTDTTVKLNDRSVGPTHQYGFTRFGYTLNSQCLGSRD